jgi:hypothetical protein
MPPATGDTVVTLSAAAITPLALLAQVTLRRTMKPELKPHIRLKQPDHDIGTAAIAPRWPLRHYNGGNL